MVCLCSLALQSSAPSPHTPGSPGDLVSPVSCAPSCPPSSSEEQALLPSVRWTHGAPGCRQEVLKCDQCPSRPTASCCPPGCGMEQELAERGREEEDGLERGFAQGLCLSRAHVRGQPLEMVPGPPVASMTGVPAFQQGEKAKHGGFCR